MKEWILILLRSIILFFVLLLLIRVMGKRQLARMSPFYFISYAVIAIISALISVNIIKNLGYGLIALGVWILFPMALDFLSLRSKLFHDLINGKPTVLVENGKVLEENLKQMRLTGNELLQELRTKNAFNLGDVEFAVMETTGELNVLLKPEKKPVTPYDLGKKVAPQIAPQTVILDGNILHEPLSKMGLNEGWLQVQLDKMGVALDNVFIGQVDSSGDLYIDLFDDILQTSQPQVKELLYAGLEKCQADLEIFSLETQNQQAKTMYEENARMLRILLEKLQPYLLR